MGLFPETDWHYSPGLVD